MKIKLLICIYLLTALGATNSKADILLGAPGLHAGTRIACKIPFKITYDLKDSYKFIFSGIQAKGDTLGAPGASGTSGNGGQFHLAGTVSEISSSRAKVGLIEFRDVQDFNSSPLQTIIISPAVVFRATSAPITINLQWSGQGNAHKPNGTFNILGEYQKDPPIPTGSLNFASGNFTLEELSNPEGTVSIVRE